MSQRGRNFQLPWVHGYLPMTNGDCLRCRRNFSSAPRVWWMFRSSDTKMCCDGRRFPELEAKGLPVTGISRHLQPPASRASCCNKARARCDQIQAIRSGKERCSTARAAMFRREPAEADGCRPGHIPGSQFAYARLVDAEGRHLPRRRYPSRRLFDRVRRGWFAAQ